MSPMELAALGVLFECALVLHPRFFARPLLQLTPRCPAAVLSQRGLLRRQVSV